jgi:hypothetical protein
MKGSPIPRWVQHVWRREYTELKAWLEKDPQNALRETYLRIPERHHRSNVYSFVISENWAEGLALLLQYDVAFPRISSRGFLEYGFECRCDEGIIVYYPITFAASRKLTRLVELLLASGCGMPPCDASIHWAWCNNFVESLRSRSAICK